MEKNQAPTESPVLPSPTADLHGVVEGGGRERCFNKGIILYYIIFSK